MSEAKAASNANYRQRLVSIEDRLAQEVEERISHNVLWHGHFIPHIQPHEFEALLLSLPDETAFTLSSSHPDVSVDDLAGKLRNIVANFNSCEEINDSYDTAPSRRLASLTPYRKGKSSGAHEWQIFQRGKLESVRQACPHFSAWLSKLEGLKK
jgi:hypothetical protein